MALVATAAHVHVESIAAATDIVSPAADVAAANAANLVASVTPAAAARPAALVTTIFSASAPAMMNRAIQFVFAGPNGRK